MGPCGGGAVMSARACACGERDIPRGQDGYSVTVEGSDPTQHGFERCTVYAGENVARVTLADGSTTLANGSWTGPEGRYGIEAAAESAAAAVRGGIIRAEDGPAFMSWMLDTYRDESRAYVDDLNLSTLHGRFCSERVS